jgi:hypothetical protein
MTNEIDEYCKNYPNDKVNCLLAAAMRNLSEGERIALKDALVGRTPKESNENKEQLPEWVVNIVNKFFEDPKRENYEYDRDYLGEVTTKLFAIKSASEIYSRMQEENNKLREALEKLIHLHNCEIDGSYQPAPATWYAAINKASEALINKP